MDWSLESGVCSTRSVMTLTLTTVHWTLSYLQRDHRWQGQNADFPLRAKHLYRKRFHWPRDMFRRRHVFPLRDRMRLAESADAHGAGC